MHEMVSDRRIGVDHARCDRRLSPVAPLGHPAARGRRAGGGRCDYRTHWARGRGLSGASCFRRSAARAIGSVRAHGPDGRGAVRAGEPKGTPWHPHRGFETVTYMIDGRFQHQDSHGGGGMIENGATQWMTAGAGILHIEPPPEELVISGGLFHGVQLWVNLPAKSKMIPPAYQGIDATAVKLAVSIDAGALVRVIA